MPICEILRLAIRSAAQVFESSEEWEEMAISISRVQVVLGDMGTFISRADVRRQQRVTRGRGAARSKVQESRLRTRNRAMMRRNTTSCPGASSVGIDS